MYSYEAIKNRIADRLNNPASKIEGSFAMDNVQAVAAELAALVAMKIQTIPDDLMLDTATGLMLDRKATEFGMARKLATSATGEIVITGTSDTVIPKDSIVLASNVEFGLVDTVTIRGGTVIATVKCLQKGTIGNVLNGVISTFKTSINGVSSVTNVSPFTNGADDETDAAFRARIYQKIRQPITSGNAADYIYWANQVTGVGQSKCLPLHAGAGTVKVVVLSDQYDVPSDNVISAVVDNIEQKRPVGALVTVSKAIPKLVTFEIALVLNPDYDFNTVKTKIKTELNNYISSITFKDTKQLSYYKIGDLIFNVDGVSDITNYTVNGAKSSISQSAEEFFKLGEVTVNGS